MTFRCEKCGVAIVPDDFGVYESCAVREYIAMIEPDAYAGRPIELQAWQHLRRLIELRMLTSMPDKCPTCGGAKDKPKLNICLTPEFHDLCPNCGHPKDTPLMKRSFRPPGKVATLHCHSPFHDKAVSDG
jgi:rRNA maturation protein Nop10